MAINFKDWQKNLQENVEQIAEDEIKVHSKDGKHIGTIYHNKYQSYALAHPTSTPGSQKEPHPDEDSKILKGPQDNQKGIDFIHAHHKMMTEALKGNQDKLDVDHDGKIEKSDLKKLRAKKNDIVVNNGQEVKENENCGKKMYREFVEEIAEIMEAKKDDYWDFKDLKDKEKNQPTSRKVAGTRYGGSAQKDEPEDDDNDDKPAVKRGRGRPAGSKSGARQKGNGNNYGGLAIHSLNLPSKK